MSDQENISGAVRSGHGGPREGAGRKGLEGGRHHIPFVVLQADYEEIVERADGIPLTEWVREAAERALVVEPGKVRLKRGEDKATIHATIPGNLRPLLEARARELGYRRLGTLLRLAVLDRLKYGMLPKSPEIEAIDSFEFGHRVVVTTRWPGPEAPRTSADFARHFPVVIFEGSEHRVVGIDAHAVQGPIARGESVAISLVPLECKDEENDD